MNINPYLEYIKNQAMYHNVHIVPSKRNGNHRVISFVHDGTSTFTGELTGYYQITFKITNYHVPFNILDKLTVLHPNLNKDEWLSVNYPNIKWVEKLDKVEILVSGVDENVIAESTGERDNFDIFIPFSNFLLFQTLKVRLTIKINKDLPIAYVLHSTPWIRDDAWLLDIEGGDAYIGQDPCDFHWLYGNKNLIETDPKWTFQESDNNKAIPL